MGKKVKTWLLDNLQSIDGNTLKIIGNPKVSDTGKGRALWFDGQKDGIFLESNPLAGMESFTVEAIFRPERGGPDTQKYIHFGEALGDRFLFETRVPDPDHWCFDAAMHSGEPSLALMDPELLHPLDQWVHAAVTFQNLEMVTYINHEKELSGSIAGFSPINHQATSIGVRMDLNSWYRGAIRVIRVTPGVLDPGEFLTLD